VAAAVAAQIRDALEAAGRLVAQIEVIQAEAA